MSIQRALRRGCSDDVEEQDIGAATARIFELLRTGEYETGSGRRLPVKGDISKVQHILGLSQTERALLANYHFMSARLAGTRQLRRGIGHIVFSSRVIYGCPVFMTVTPSERHSGLVLRLLDTVAKTQVFDTLIQNFYRMLVTTHRVCVHQMRPMRRLWK